MIPADATWATSCHNSTATLFNLVPYRVGWGLNLQKPKIVGGYSDDTCVVVRIGNVKAWLVGRWDGELRDNNSACISYRSGHLEQVDVLCAWQLVPNKIWGATNYNSWINICGQWWIHGPGKLCWESGTCTGNVDYDNLIFWGSILPKCADRKMFGTIIRLRVDTSKFKFVSRKVERLDHAGWDSSSYSVSNWRCQSKKPGHQKSIP